MPLKRRGAAVVGSVVMLHGRFVKIWGSGLRLVSPAGLTSVA